MTRPELTHVAQRHRRVWEGVAWFGAMGGRLSQVGGTEEFPCDTNLIAAVLSAIVKLDLH